MPGRRCRRIFGGRGAPVAGRHRARILHAGCGPGPRGRRQRVIPGTGGDIDPGDNHHGRDNAEHPGPGFERNRDRGRGDEQGHRFAVVALRRGPGTDDDRRGRARVGRPKVRCPHTVWRAPEGRRDRILQDRLPVGFGREKVSARFSRFGDG